ncbi:MAG: DUF6531 domain-containing protein [Anaerolineae bacterium]
MTNNIFQPFNLKLFLICCLYTHIEGTPLSRSFEVENNPINFIDPLKLKSAEFCAYPAGTITENGKSASGHGFWVLTKDNGDVIVIGRYPGRPRFDDKIIPGTLSFEVPATDAQIDAIISRLSKGDYWGIAGNCIDGLEWGLEILGIEHPSFNFLGVSLPTKAVIWIENLNGTNDFKQALEQDLRFAADPDLFWPAIRSAPPVIQPECPYAHTIEPTRKIGNLQKTFIDMSFPIPGEFSLELVRYYNSFNERNGGFGRGWDVVPASLHFPRKRDRIRWEEKHMMGEVFPEIFVFEEGNQDRFSLQGFDPRVLPIYQSEETAAFLVEQENGQFALWKEDVVLFFDPAGKLVQKIDKQGKSLWFLYDSDRLVSIAHENGKKLQLEYQDERIVRAKGPEGKTIDYQYDEDGQLCCVAGQEGIITFYGYDSEKNLSAIYDAKKRLLFEASYDSYHRATFVTRGKTSTENGYNDFHCLMQIILKKAEAECIDFVCFPEGFLTGYYAEEAPCSQELIGGGQGGL